MTNDEMDDVLLTHDGELRSGEVVERPNRFVLRVRFDATPERVFLGDPGALAVLTPGDTVLCSPVADADRKTDYDAIAVGKDVFYVSLRASLANELFAEALRRNLVPAFDGYRIAKREPQFPSHGRADFRLARPEGGDGAYVEVKSCTHAEAGVGKFPDRQTERGRRHLRALRGLVDDGVEAHLVFVGQRPDIDRIEPFSAVDPEFATLLGEVAAAGVGVHAITTEFAPPRYVLRDPSVPVDTDPDDSADTA